MVSINLAHFDLAAIHKPKNQLTPTGSRFVASVVNHWPATQHVGGAKVRKGTGFVVWLKQLRLFKHLEV